MRCLVYLGLVVLLSGFVFFAGTIIWLGLREFFKMYLAKIKSGKSGSSSGSTT